MAGDDGLVPLSRLLHALKSSGLWRNDPRLARTMKLIKSYTEGQREFDTHRDVMLTKEMFDKCICDSTALIRRAFGGSFVIPSFSSFCAVINNIYWECRTHSEGKVCSRD